MEECLKECWDALSDFLFESLVESMLRRIVVCIAVKGWYIKY